MKANSSFFIMFCFWLGTNYMNPGYFTLAATDLKP